MEKPMEAIANLNVLEDTFEEEGSEFRRFKIFIPEGLK
jgi:hypothetical protein